MSQYYNNPETWAAIHKEFADRFGADNVLIAGGCVRDYLKSKRQGVNDIDVFVRFSKPLYWEMAELRIRDEIFGFGGDAISDPYRAGFDPGYENQQSSWLGHGDVWLRRAFEARGNARTKEYRVNVIGRTDVDATKPEEFIETFDLNVCKAWANPDDGFKPAMTAACEMDFANKRITTNLDEGKISENTYRRASRFAKNMGFENQVLRKKQSISKDGIFKYATYADLLIEEQPRRAQGPWFMGAGNNGPRWEQVAVVGN